MPLTNKDILDLLRSLGIHETARHLLDLPVDVDQDPYELSLRNKLTYLKKKYSQIQKSASRPTGKAALESFHCRTFELPVRRENQSR